LAAVTHLEASEHLGNNDATSYFIYRGWRCPFGDMGFQSCRIPARAPYRAKILALDCSIASGGCPRRLPPGYL
jgi:hypothetical protein